MAFKKKGKVTKKKGKKSGGKRDEWSHEGGVVLDGKEAENAEEKGRTKRRLTQDREESIRRGKLKNNDRKKKQDFKKKMAKKVKFGDVVAKLREEEASSNDGSEGEEQVAKKQRVVRANPLNTMDRLQLFVSKAKQQRDVSSDGEEADGSERDSDAEDDAGEDDEQYESDGSMGEDEDGQDDESVVSDDDEEGVEKDKFVADQDVNDDAQSDAGDSDGEGDVRNGAISKSEYYYEYMFNQEHAARSSEGGKMKHLDSVDEQDMEVYGALSFPDSDGALPISPGPYHTIAQMPGLHKLFRGPAATARVDPGTFPGVSAYALPYLASYADTFVEGRDHVNDPEMLQGMLVHAVTHTVKAR
jgi:hypothetical protein